jgi:catalase
MSRMAPTEGDTVRGSPEKFADHYTQAELFWNSQTTTEKAHIIGAFRFELTRVQVPAIRERVVSLLLNVSPELGEAVAEAIGLTGVTPAPAARPKVASPEVDRSAALSLFARPGQTGIRGRRVAIVVTEGTDGDALNAIHQRLADEGAVARRVGLRLGAVSARGGDPIAVDATLETMPGVLFGALVLAGGDPGVRELAGAGQAHEYLRDQYRHCKPILVLDGARELLSNAGIPDTLDDGTADPGLIIAGANTNAAVDEFVSAMASHRQYARETDPPRV